MYSLPPKETSVRYGGQTWELSRLFVEDEMPANTETWFISATVKDLRKRFRAVRFLVSYADPTVGHAGIIYRAANWTPDGMTGDERKRQDYFVNGVKFGRRGHIPEGVEFECKDRISKSRFFYPLGRTA